MPDSLPPRDQPPEFHPHPVPQRAPYQCPFPIPRPRQRNLVPNQYPNQQRNFAQQRRHGLRRPAKQFDPVPMPYGRILPLLLNSSLMQLREAKAPPTPLPPNYDVNVRCEYHSGTPGHSIEDCKSLKYKVQDLIDSRAIMLTPQGLNIVNTPMHPQEGTSAMP
ncbi:unnamed protein product [Lathyrus oleraceus]